MKRVWLVGSLVMLGLLPGVAEGGPVTLEWNASQGASDYVVEQSVDQGATWTVAQTVQPVACSGTPARCTVTHPAPATGLVLFRFSARNSVGISTRYSEGAWHCQSCAPPPPVTGLGVR